MEQLLTISTIGFIISAVAAVIGAVLSAVTFWRFDIREVFLIRSGKGLKNALIGMEKQRAETGTLRNAPQKPEKKAKKRAKDKKKSNLKAPETAPLKAAPETVPLSTAPETVMLNRADETMMLDQGQAIPAEAEDDFLLSGEKAEFEIISAEIETHTEEDIDIK